MKIKRILSCLLLLCLVINLCACRKKANLNSELSNSHPTLNTNKVVEEESSEIENTSEPVEAPRKPSGTVSVPSKVETAQAPVSEPVPEVTPVWQPKNLSNMKCIWLSQYDMNKIYCEKGKQQKQSTYEKTVSRVLDQIKSCGFNTVFLQMRPFADSMYPSEYYPPSYIVVGQYGKEFNYDPIKIFINEAHKRDISVHAWINPMRAVTDEQIKLIDNKYVIKQWYNSPEKLNKYLVYVGNRWYLNPAYEEVRQLIINGAVEIALKYSVDGIHMDDYFYPTTDASFDESAYSAYLSSGGILSLADFRRDCLNCLIRGMYSAIKGINGNLIYGISPAGNYYTVYNEQYADIYSWCSNSGYIDYICPQVYFGLEHQTFDFKTVCQKWQEMITPQSGVKLMIGMTLGKALSEVDADAGTGGDEWRNHKDILKNCLLYTKQLNCCVGVSYFSYQYFYEPVSGNSITKTEAERNNFLPVLADISWQ